MGRKVRRGCDYCSRSPSPGIGSKSLNFFCCSPFRRQHVNSDVSAPPPGGFFLGFFDEVDAASGAGGDWRRDPDGDDGAAGAVIFWATQPH